MGFWAALEEVYGETRQQRCWMHKTMNVLNALPKTVHEIWQADSKANAEKAFDLFIETYEPKYPKRPCACRRTGMNCWPFNEILR